MPRTGRPLKIQAEDVAHLVAILQSDATASLEEIRTEFKRCTGIDVHTQTIIKTLRNHGIKRVGSRDAVVVKKAAPAPVRYGYTDAHRRVEPEQSYPSCLTDAEWELVRDLRSPAHAARLRKSAVAPWSMPAATWYARGAPGACCRHTFRLGRMFIAPSAAGASKANSR